MKISAVKAVLTEKDVLGIIKEYVKIEGLFLEELTINEFIVLKGTYKKKISIPFIIKIGLGSIKDNLLKIKIFNVKIAKIGILNSIKNFALKNILKDFKKYGIEVDKDTVSLDLNGVSQFIPYFYFKLNKITITNGALEAEIEDMVYAKDKEIPEIEEEEKKYTTPQDCYTKFRKDIENNIPSKYEKILEYAMIIPDIVALLWRIFKDKRVDTFTKAKAIGVVGYLAMPFDILPDFIPFIGKIDDIAVAFYGLNSIINDIPEEIILENWQGEKNIIIIVKEGVKYIAEIVGSQNISTLLATIKNLSKNENKKKNNEKDKNCNLENNRAVNEE
ncbi:YkvA family protein [Clostridium tetanomorphum]|uniref:DUF1232 domain-containing protein n=1 Tax=Clostridium tetanomorphum TaxID=1553 RepID=A0A923E684_CLOTT|nr:DUF1232 domain-containing protein [Clostridium tetanomorphum]MBC2397138.1 DUF1232 domain-containing protein [Clostridium tetanomorphum]NRZ99015.1 uncharacterized membrane protein YkvA (DUF1232 family) [Clostridium tetanomorphum]